ncbi:MAG: FxsA family protein [Pseudomonadales bacterium]
MGKWTLVFFLTPLVEMYILIEVGGQIGAMPTVLLVVLTAVVGVALLRRQGFQTLTRGLSRLEQGQVPAIEVVEGLLLAVAGALLLTPGFLTDVVGFTLLAPLARNKIAKTVLAQVNLKSPAERPAGAGDTIEGDFQRRP